MSSKNSNNNNLYKKNKVSESKLEKFNLSTHLIDFLWNEPFYSRILRSLNKIETKEIPTAGVAIVNKEITLWWNREFLAGLSKTQTRGLLKHECLHLVFGHTTERKRDPHLIWNYATDLAINSTIPEHELPEGGLIPGKHLSIEESQMSQMTKEEIESFTAISSLIASLPRDKTSEYYFDKLSQNEEIQKMSKKSDQFFELGFDDHNDWGEMSDEDAEIFKAKVKEIVKEAVKESNERGWGTVSSSLRSEIMKMISNEIKWESLLKRFCGYTKRDERRSSIRRLNKKYPGIHSGYKKIYKPSIAVYIDESGSVSDEELQKFYSELDNLSNKTDFYLYKFDTRVDDKNSFLWKKKSRPNMSRTLVGGTCFESVTKHAIKNRKKFDAYMILTDGAAPKPSLSLGIKRCWILASGCNLVFQSDENDIVIKIK